MYRVQSMYDGFTIMYVHMYGAFRLISFDSLYLIKFFCILSRYVFLQSLYSFIRCIIKALPRLLFF